MLFRDWVNMMDASDVLFGGVRCEKVEVRFDVGLKSNKEVASQNHPVLASASTPLHRLHSQLSCLPSVYIPSIMSAPMAIDQSLDSVSATLRSCGVSSISPMASHRPEAHQGEQEEAARWPQAC